MTRLVPSQMVAVAKCFVAVDAYKRRFGFRLLFDDHRPPCCTCVCARAAGHIVFEELGGTHGRFLIQRDG